MALLRVGATALERPGAEAKAPPCLRQITEAVPKRGLPAPAVANAAGADKDPGLRRPGAGGAAPPPAVRPASFIGVETVGDAPASVRPGRPPAGVLAPLLGVPVEAVAPVVLAAGGPGADVPGEVLVVQAPDDGAGAPTGGAVAAVAAPVQAGRPKWAAVPTEAAAMVAARHVAITPSLVPQTPFGAPVADAVAAPASPVVPVATGRPVEVGL